jgi:hypothetical protein
MFAFVGVAVVCYICCICNFRGERGKVNNQCKDSNLNSKRNHQTGYYYAYNAMSPRTAFIRKGGHCICMDTQSQHMYESRGKYVRVSLSGW